MRKTKKKSEKSININNFMQMSLLEIIKNEEAKISDIRRFNKFLMDMLTCKGDLWRGLVMTPPASFIEKIIQIFDRQSDFPLELPFFIFFHMLSGELLTKGITLKYGESVKHPQLWSVILADSGGGKTTTFDLFKDVFQLKSFYDYSGISSREKFVEELAENNNKLFVADEFWNEASKMKDGKPLEQMKTDFLKIYSHTEVKALSRKGANVIVKKPVMSHLGITVGKDIKNCLSMTDIFRGYCQRIRWIFARRQKPIQPAEDIHLEVLKDEWEKIWIKVKYTQYKAHPDAREAVKESFNFFRKSNETLDASYFKRIMDDAHSYALLYHIMLGKGDVETVDLEDYGWAARVLGLFYNDIKEFLNEATDSELEKTLKSCERVFKKLKEQGKECKPRDLVRGVYNIKTTEQAKMYLQQLQSGSMETPNTKEEVIEV